MTSFPTWMAALPLMVASVWVSGCQKGIQALPEGTQQPPEFGGGSSSTEDDVVVVDEAPSWSTRDRLLLFEGSHIPVFELSLPAERWEELQRDARDEEYVDADLQFEGESVGTVGLRFKGYATLSYCFDGDTMVCDKLSMKLRFDEFEPDLRFFGLKRLAFNSMHFDESLLHEKLAYDLYQAMGVASPHAFWAKLVINGESLGLFSMVEPVDGRFTDDRWPDDGDNNLYKELWPSMGGASYYNERLENNKETANHDGIDAFHEELMSARDATARHEVLDNWMDLDALYRYVVVDDAINASDGLTTFYAASDLAWRSNHNVFLYQQSEPQRFYAIPWDLDNAFWAYNLTMVPHFSRTPENCDQVYTDGEGSGVRVAPGCDPVFQGLAADMSHYRKVADELLDGPFSESAMFASIDEWTTLLASSVEEDPFLSPSVWAQRVAEIRAALPFLRARLVAFRDGVAVDPLWLERDVLNDFDTVTAASALFGCDVNANDGTTAQLAVTEGDEGAPDSALRMDFQYRDGSESSSHYAVFAVRVNRDAQDLSGHVGVRFRARSDEARYLRMELISEAHTPLGTYIYEGWDIDLTSDWQTVELRFDAAALPTWASKDDLDAQNELEDVLRTLLKLRFYASAVGLDSTDQLGEDNVDEGFVDLDDLEFF